MRVALATAVLVIVSACGGGISPLPDAEELESSPVVTAVDRSQEVADLTDARTNMLEDIGNDIP